MKGFTDEEAVAPVVAVMLVLAVVVTFLAVYNASIVPSLKAEAEVMHIGDVEESFLRFAADIDSAAGMKRPVQLSESLVLGGGDMLLNGARSGGMLAITHEDEEIFSVTCNGTTYKSGLVGISYVPAASFWQDQGYTWQYGYLNVTQGQIATPLLYTDMDAVADDLSTSGFFSSLIGIEAENGYVPVNVVNVNDNSTYTKSVDKHCTGITISVINMSTGKAYVSGNGPAMLTLNVSMREPVVIDAPESLSIAVNETFLGQDAMLPCGEPVWDVCERSLSEFTDEYPNVYGYHPGADGNMTVSFDTTVTPVEVRIQMVDVMVSVS
ncbi:hypothetical protein [Methanogenium cariaci]